MTNNTENNLVNVITCVRNARLSLYAFLGTIKSLHDALDNQDAKEFPLEVQNVPSTVANDRAYAIEALLLQVNNEARYHLDLARETENFVDLLRGEGHPADKIDSYAQHLARRLVNKQHGRRFVG